MIGLTIVAIGTSLPELAASATAAWKGNTDIAVGNVVGSNLFNVLLILGISGLVSPLPCAAAFDQEFAVLCAMTGLLCLALAIRPRVGRIHAGVLLAAYAACLVAACVE